MTDTCCLAWYISSTKKLPFERGLTSSNNPIYFYLPFRCPKNRIAGDKVCERCSNNKKKSGYTGLGLYWGLVTEPISNITVIKKQTNHIAFSPWFLEQVTEYGISDENLQKAREAWRLAVFGLNEVPPIPDMVKGEPASKKGKKKAVEPVVTAPATTEPVTTAPAVTAEPVAVVKPKVKKRQPKAVIATEPIAIIIEEKPVEVEVELINVVIRELNGTKYYVDTSKSKVYDVKNGSYVGRWDSVTERLVTTRPDSDAE
jgi:hypothetical protein